MFSSCGLVYTDLHKYLRRLYCFKDSRKKKTLTNTPLTLLSVLDADGAHVPPLVAVLRLVLVPARLEDDARLGPVHGDVLALPVGVDDVAGASVEAVLAARDGGVCPGELN